MLTDSEAAALDALRTARDLLAADGDPSHHAAQACETAIREVHAIGGHRDQSNVEQADYLAERVAALTGQLAEPEAPAVRVERDGQAAP